MRFNLQEGGLTPIQTLPPNRYPPGTLRISQIETIPKPPLNPNFNPNPELQQILAGKQLLLDDLPFILEEIQHHYENGCITYNKGISTIGKTSSCARCGNRNPQLFGSFTCARCGDMCTYCRKCLMMGRISECTPLIGWSGPPPAFDIPAKVLEWEGTLSDGQQNASNRAVEAVLQNTNLLVWAVCAAGYEYVRKGY
ncbi:hypothetical protein D1B31_16085 [Neobacillus notoginsengisoli]|uniref:Uncharacterized protein n=1 Tax=Neobacillus notoginsengisoli TaxID=1578198 RepID=A0A417YRC0_9BACI|nr:hypothetical protein [Neobacillus notoginsengisoli]RHW37286.1 hypothetical protein D1B31_16085 [Neobacillus notoginsengisoli]